MPSRPVLGPMAMGVPSPVRQWGGCGGGDDWWSGDGEGEGLGGDAAGVDGDDAHGGGADGDAGEGDGGVEVEDGGGDGGVGGDGDDAGDGAGEAAGDVELAGGAHGDGLGGVEGAYGGGGVEEWQFLGADVDGEGMRGGAAGAGGGEGDGGGAFSYAAQHQDRLVQRRLDDGGVARGDAVGGDLAGEQRRHVVHVDGVDGEGPGVELEVESGRRRGGDEDPEVLRGGAGAVGGADGHERVALTNAGDRHRRVRHRHAHQGGVRGCGAVGVHRSRERRSDVDLGGLAEGDAHVDNEVLSGRAGLLLSGRGHRRGAAEDHHHDPQHDELAGLAHHAPPLSERRHNISSL